MLVRRCQNPESPIRTLVDLLAESGIDRRETAGSRIFEAGQPAHSFFYLAAGTVRAVRADAEGREIEVDRFGAGDFFGEVILFAGETFPVGAETVNECRLIEYPRSAIMHRIATEPAVAGAFLRLLATKCLRLRGRIEELGLGSARSRLAGWLLKNCTGDGNCTIKLATTKADLARALGIAPETLSRNLLRLQNEGLIAVEKRQIRIRDCAALKKFEF